MLRELLLQEKQKIPAKTIEYILTNCLQVTFSNLLSQSLALSPSFLTRDSSFKLNCSAPRSKTPINSNIDPRYKSGVFGDKKQNTLSYILWFLHFPQGLI